MASPLPPALARVLRVVRYLALVGGASWAYSTLRTARNLLHPSRGFRFPQQHEEGGLSADVAQSPPGSSLRPPLPLARPPSSLLFARASVDALLSLLLKVGELALALSRPAIAWQLLQAYLGLDGPRPRMLRGEDKGKGSAAAGAGSSPSPSPSRSPSSSPPVPVLRGVPYGPGSLQTADVYFPPPSTAPSHTPILLLVHGGAWSWGAAWQYAGCARALSDALSVVVVNVDYRAYPDGNVDEMAADVLLAADMARRRAREWGCLPPDPLATTSSSSSFSAAAPSSPQPHIHFLGHSAGSHLIALALLRAAERVALAGASSNAQSVTSPSPSSPSPHHHHPSLVAPPDPSTSTAPLPLDLCRDVLSASRSAVCVAGVYDILAHYEFEASRVVSVGLVSGGAMGAVRASVATALEASAAAAGPLCSDRVRRGGFAFPFGYIIDGVEGISPMAPAMRGRLGFWARSPTRFLPTLPPAALPLLPPFTLVHGTKDTTAPVEGSRAFARAYADLAASSASAAAPCSPMRLVEIADLGHAEVLFDLMEGAGGSSLADGWVGHVDGDDGDDRATTPASPHLHVRPARTDGWRPRRWADPLMAAVVDAIARAEGEGPSEGKGRAEAAGLGQGGRG